MILVSAAPKCAPVPGPVPGTVDNRGTNDGYVAGTDSEVLLTVVAGRTCVLLPQHPSCLSY
jgi:hypothetical protein